MKLGRSAIVDKLKEILATMDDKHDLSVVDENTDLRVGLELTSVGMLYFVIVIEEAFAIDFDGGNVNDFKTVGDVVSYIEEKMQ